MAQERCALARRIAETAQLTGTFTLRSGLTTSTYFDKYQFEARPDLLQAIAVALAERVDDEIDVLAGLELGGVPIATALSLHTGLPAAFVRKVAKPYGTARLAEGADIDGQRVLVVEDVVTTGGQLLTSIGDLRERGARIDTALCVIDREQGGAGALAEIGVELRPLFTAADFGSPSTAELTDDR